MIKNLLTHIAILCFIIGTGVVLKGCIPLQRNMTKTLEDVITVEEDLINVEKETSDEV